MQNKDHIYEGEDLDLSIYERDESKTENVIVQIEDEIKLQKLDVMNRMFGVLAGAKHERF